MNGEQSGMWKTSFNQNIYLIDGSNRVNNRVKIGFYDRYGILLHRLKPDRVTGQKINNPEPIELRKKA